MSFRVLPMIEVSDLLRHWQAKHSIHRCARDTSANRKTVRRYYATASFLQLPRDQPLTDEQIHAVVSRLTPKPAPLLSEDTQRLVEVADKIRDWLAQSPPLRLQKIQILLQRLGVDVPYYTLRRFCIARLGWAKPKTTVRVDAPPPGQEAQLDFAKMGRVLDPASGQPRALWVLIVTLVYSRMVFVYPTFLQTTAAVCEGLDAAWRFFGGMPRVLIPDNTKAIVHTASKTEVRLVEAFSDYVQHRGLFVDPARVRRPRDKPHVERQVRYVRDNWFAGESFSGLPVSREQAERWCRETAARRVHGTTRKIPQEVYDQVEKTSMLPAPDAPFDVPVWQTSTVQNDQHVQAQQALYSVPHLYVGRELHLRLDRSLVKVYDGTELVCLHERVAPGERSTKPEHFPQHQHEYASRKIDAVRERLQALGQHIGQVGERLLAGPLPWTKMRQAYALERLCTKYGAGTVEAVCQSALAFDVVEVDRIKSVLERAQQLPQSRQGKVVVMRESPARFARASEHFATKKKSQEEPG